MQQYQLLGVAIVKEKERESKKIIGLICERYGIALTHTHVHKPFYL